jgi:RNA polymerase sigma factor (sigma-70 family)
MIRPAWPFRPRLVERDETPPRGAPQRAPRLGASEAERFRATVLPHLDAAYSYARYLTRDVSAAEDVVQEAFVRALHAFGSQRGESAKAWLMAIVRNCFLDQVRGARARAGHVERAASGEPDAEFEHPEAILLRAGEADRLRKAVESLPEPFRETLVLREFEEFSYKEIAQLTEVPIGTVMSRLARAREALAALLVGETAEGGGRW